MIKTTSSRFTHRCAALARTAVLATCAFGALESAQAEGAAQPGPGGYPATGRVTIVVPFAAGGATDIVARLLADELGRRWGNPVVVDNKPGAGGGIGTDYVARAKPDGYTLLLGTQTALSVNPLLIKNMSYNVDKDFAPVTALATTPLVLLAGKKAGAKDVKSLVAAIKAQPGTLTYGSSGPGTSQHLTALMFLNRIGGQAIQVPYKGSSQSLVDLAGGQIDMQFDNMSTALAFAKSNQATALAVTSATRSPLAPDLPTLAESGVPGFEASTWLGLLAPAATPAPTVAWLNAQVVAVLRSPQVAERLAVQGFTPQPMESAAFRRFIKDETLKFADIINKNKVTLD